MNQEIQAILHEALICSVYICPDNPGLTYEEVCSVAKRFDFFDGEIGDAAAQVLDNYEGRKYLPKKNAFIFLIAGSAEDPSLLNYQAADFIFDQLNLSVRQVGASTAGVDKNVIIARAISHGIADNDVRAAITFLRMGGVLKDDKGVIRYTDTFGIKSPLSSQRSRHHQISRPYRARVLEIVRDIVGRREDGRPAQIEAFDAFADVLSKIGYGHFRLWWAQMAGEIRRIEPTQNPVSSLVLSAALAEAALTFAARYARDKSLEFFRSNNFDGEPRSWRMEKLIESAALGGSQAILDGPAKTAAERLHIMRQRIHAGRMLSDHPQSLPDLKPEEAAAGMATAKQITRAVLEWLSRVSPA